MNELRLLLKTDDSPERLFARSNVRAQLGPGELEIIIRKKKRIRSLAMNSYYWAEVVPKVQQGLKETGLLLTVDGVHDWLGEFFDVAKPEHVHEFLKHMFIEKISVDEDTGEIFKNELSTKRMARDDFWEYVEQIIQFAAEKLNVQIMYPREQSRLEME